MTRRSAKRPTALLLAAVTATLTYRWASSWHSAALPTDTAFAAPCTPASTSLQGPHWGLQDARQRQGESSIGQRSFGCSTASEPIRHALHIPVRLQKWYDHWIGPVNLSRQSMRISGLEDYAVVASVIMQVLVGFYSGVAEPEEGCTRMERLIYDIQMALLMGAVLCSTFTMVMFLLNKICDVTALGMYKDVSYATFMQLTTRHRVTAFWSLYVSLVSFLITFALDLLRRIKGKRGFAAKVVALGAGTLMLISWSKMMFLANTHLFNGTPRIG